ncbi:hypothetical protein ACSFBI_32555 [Variovorax sp. RB3P1]|uniref:hypothetical protein n=1 Tax=Variovorax sp. RB3P1 TaxID=3443732 RepID=UPI003F45BCB5
MLLLSARSRQSTSTRNRASGYAFVHDPEQVRTLLRLLESLDRGTLFSHWRQVSANLGLPDEELEYECIAGCMFRLRACYEAAATVGTSVLSVPQQ